MKESEWALIEDAKPQGSSDGFWYDLTDGGYIDLDRLIKDPEQLREAKEAVELLESLELALNNATLLNEF